MAIINLNETEVSVLREALSGYMLRLDDQRENLLSTADFGPTNREQYELRMQTAELLKQKLYDPQG